MCMDVRVSVTATGIEEDTDIQSEGGGGELSESDLPSHPFLFLFLERPVDLQNCP